MATGNNVSRANVFLNYQLTKTRSTIAFHIRKCKRDGKIHSYQIDANGKITIRVKNGEEKKVIEKLSDLSDIIDIQ